MYSKLISKLINPLLQSGPVLPRTGDSLWDKAVDVMQKGMHFLGAWSYAVSAISIALGVFLWYMGSKESWVGMALRVAGACIVLLNIPFIIGMFRL